MWKSQSKYVTLDVRKTDTIENIMEMIEIHENIPTDYQKMFFGGNQLELSQTIEHYKIRSDSTILLRLRGM